MTTHASHPCRFVPGTTGWTEEDLDDPAIEPIWDGGGYEIVEGVLTRMPAADLEGSLPLRRLVRQVERQLEQNNLPGEFAFEVDMVINRIRVPRVDAMFLTPAQLQQQAAIEAARKRRKGVKFGRLRVPPTLVVESLSLDHEDHDEITKREWYRGFGIPHYWLLDPFRHSLECLKLEQDEYKTNAAGRDSDAVTPSLFPELTVQLAPIWM
ncbi:MAG TPA: Uma2 family endonuclease [Tepidisphaeraceae bacterium]